MFVGTEGHVFVRDPTSHLVTDPDSTAHVKICTGGKILQKKMQVFFVKTFLAP